MKFLPVVFAFHFREVFPWKQAAGAHPIGSTLVKDERRVRGSEEVGGHSLSYLLLESLPLHEDWSASLSSAISADEWH